MKKNIEISTKVLDVQVCRSFVTADNNGAECLFIGTVRNQTTGKPVDKLHFEAYETMAVKEMDKIADQALAQFDIEAICIHHRVGELKVGEIPVIIAVGSAHRDAAFKACQFAIDTLKETVPIWKKEFFNDGAVWVTPNP